MVVEAIKFGLKERRIFVGSEEGEINCINAASRPKKRAFFCGESRTMVTMTSPKCNFEEIHG